MPSEFREPLGKVVEVIAALREEDGGPALIEGVEHVIEDELVPAYIGREGRIEVLDALPPLHLLRLEARVPDD